MSGGYINTSGNYKFDELGIIRVNVRSTARSVRARWKGGQIVVSAPTGIEFDRLLGILRDFMPKMHTTKPDSPYFIGQTIDLHDFKIHIHEQNHIPDRIYSDFKDGEGHIYVGKSWNTDEADTIKTISKMICSFAQHMAPGILIPHARKIAGEVGKTPLSWEISNGHRLLGKCSSRGVISLSYALLFYPPHLRDFVVLHELAHLSEMNHSAHFHELCDKYCGGREHELDQELRQYKIPIVI